jgi:hypothetical protein
MEKLNENGLSQLNSLSPFGTLILFWKNHLVLLMAVVSFLELGVDQLCVWIWWMLVGMEDVVSSQGICILCVTSELFVCDLGSEEESRETACVW